MRIRLGVAPYSDEKNFIVTDAIPDDALSLDSLPLVDDQEAVFAFAMTFDGAKHFGSFELAVKNARARSRTTLVDVRNELFMAARASRHIGNDRYLATYSELLPHFQRLLRDRLA
jgi:hypothetical protein